MVALGVFIVLWALNFERRLDKYQLIVNDATRQHYKSIIVEEMKRHRPQDADKAEAIVDHLFTMPQIQTETDAQRFLEEYRQAVAKGVGRELS